MTPLDWLLASLVVGLALALWRQIVVARNARRDMNTVILASRLLGPSLNHDERRDYKLMKDNSAWKMSPNNPRNHTDKYT